jgi:hypothetical protein
MTENNRATEEQGRRRRRSSDYNGQYMRLGVDKSLLDPAYEYRWINDDRGRLEARYEEDWDFVSDEKILSDSDRNEKTDTRIRRIVGTASGGKPMYAYYCRKRKEYCEEDRREKHDARMAQREQMIRNQDTGASGGVSGDPQHTYIPAEARAAIAASPELRRVRRA